MSYKLINHRLGFAPVVVLLLLLVVLVLVGGGVYWYFNLRDQSESPLTQVTPTTKTAFDLVVESPTDQTLVESKKLVVKGKTAPNVTVTIFTENDEIIVESDASGRFEGTINLAVGINSLVVTAFSSEGEEKTVAMDVVYDEST